MSERTAIVVGAGIAGMIAARALADRFARVLVIDRDRDVDRRPHVPQLPHSHVLGARGYRLVCSQFEGFDAAMEAAGAPLFDFGECPFYAGQWAPRGKLGLISRSSTRALLERVLRDRLVTRPNVELVTGARVCELVVEGSRVVAVRFADGREAAARLVVDAAGVGSRTPEWLARSGFPAPPRTEVDLRGGMITQLFRPAASRRREWGMLILRRSGDNLRSGSVSWVEGGLWRVSMWGTGGVRPPRAAEGFVEFARQMAPPIIAELLEDAEAVSPQWHYTNSWSQWIHYERLPRFPDGLVVMGDAAFHPNYEHAQGMTFCAMTAEMLIEHLDRHGLGERPGASLGFQRALGARVAPWWDWNMAAERVVPGIAAPPTSPADDVRHRYFRWLRRTSLGDPALWKLVLEVNQALRSPRELLWPAAPWRGLSRLPRSA